MKNPPVMRPRRLTLISVLTVGLLSTMLATNASAKPNEDPNPKFTLTILHNNDGESDLLPRGFEGEEGSVARFKTVVDREMMAARTNGHGKKNKRDVIMLSSGDNFLAGPEFTASLNDGIFYDALALDAIGYDAIDLGNHDFDFGPDILADFISEGFSDPGVPPYLSSNLDFSAEPALQALVDSDVIAASTVVKKRGEEIAVIGATTENLPFISSPRNVVVNAVLPAVQAEVAEAEANGIDKIILISHLQDIDGDIALATQLSGVDIMIAGGGDELLANPDDLLLPSDGPDDVFGSYPQIATDADGVQVPVVTTSGGYGYLGRLVVDFDKDGNLLGWDGGPIRIVDESFADGAAPDPGLVGTVEEPVTEFVAALDEQILGVSEVNLDGGRSAVRATETNEGNLIADSQLWQARQVDPDVDVALQNGGGIRNDSIIPAGNISALDTFAMVPFPNFVTIVPDIPRDQFKEILENAVSRTQPGDTPGGTGRFAQVAGFSFVYDGAGTAQVLDDDGNVTVAGSRVQTVTLDDDTSVVSDGDVMPGPAIDIAIVDFSARGGDEYPFRGAPFDIIGFSYQQALANYIQGPLAGTITAAEYPVGGEGRITEL